MKKYLLLFILLFIYSGCDGIFKSKINLSSCDLHIKEEKVYTHLNIEVPKCINKKGVPTKKVERIKKTIIKNFDKSKYIGCTGLNEPGLQSYTNFILPININSKIINNKYLNLKKIKKNEINLYIPSFLKKIEDRKENQKKENNFKVELILNNDTKEDKKIHLFSFNKNNELKKIKTINIEKNNIYKFKSDMFKIIY